MIQMAKPETKMIPPYVTSLVTSARIKGEGTRALIIERVLMPTTAIMRPVDVNVGGRNEGRNRWGRYRKSRCA